MNRHYPAEVAILILAAAVGVAGTRAMASTGPTVSVRVPDSISITIPDEVSLNAQVGSQVISPMSINVKSNTNWSLSIYKESDLTGGPESETIPSSQFVYTATTSNGIGVASDTEFSDGAPSDVVTNGTHTGEAGATVIINYKLTVGYDDHPGEYSAIHSFVIATP